MLTGVKTDTDLNTKKLTANLHMAPDGLKADNFLAVLPPLGNLTGLGAIDSKNNLDFKMVANLANAAAAPPRAARGTPEWGPRGLCGDPDPSTPAPGRTEAR